MFIVSRRVGEAFIVDEAIVFTVGAIQGDSVTLECADDRGKPIGDCVIDPDGFLEIMGGVAATHFPFVSGCARIGLIAKSGVKIRVLPQSRGLERRN